MYHGTARPTVKNILSEGLRPTYGMLGTAVYLGSFWKAFRFATFTQTYEKRPGAVLRCYCFPTKLPLIKTVSSNRCQCDKCTGGQSGQSGQGDKFGQAGLLCDHLGLWQKVTDMVIAWPTPGAPIKNEECAMPDGTLIVVDSVAHVTCHTEHHEPLNRKLLVD